MAESKSTTRCKHTSGWYAFDVTVVVGHGDPPENTWVKFGKVRL